MDFFISQKKRRKEYKILKSLVSSKSFLSTQSLLNLLLRVCEIISPLIFTFHFNRRTRKFETFFFHLFSSCLNSISIQWFSFFHSDKNSVDSLANYGIRPIGRAIVKKRSDKVNWKFALFFFILPFSVGWHI